MPASKTTSSLTLYEISTEGQFIQDCLIDAEGELTPEIEERLNALMVAGTDKLESAAMVMANLESTVEACKAESKRLADRAKAFEANIESLRARMTAALDMAFNGKIKTAKFTLWTQKAADSYVIDLAEECSLEKLEKERPEFVRTKLELDKVAIRSAYDAETPLPDSIFVTKSDGKRYLRVK